MHRVFLAQRNPTVERAWETTLALIAELRRMVESAGGRFVLFYIPFSDEVNPDWWEETVSASPPLQEQEWDLGGPERRLRAFCDGAGIEFLSPRELMARDEQFGTDRFYFKHGHLNESGHSLVADQVAAWLLNGSASG